MIKKAGITPAKIVIALVQSDTSDLNLNTC